MQVLTQSKNIENIKINKPNSKLKQMQKNVQWWHHIASFIITMLGIWAFFSNKADEIEKKIEKTTEKRATIDENVQQRLKFLEEKDASHNLYLDKKFTEIRDDIKETNKKVDQIYSNTKQNR
jgi:ABC-type nickel/cobalt efflux system permease component RcnA